MPGMTYIFKRLLDPASGAYIDEQTASDRTDVGASVAATGGEDTAITITLEPGKTLYIARISVAGDDAAVYKVTDGSNTYLVFKATSKDLAASDPMKNPVVLVRNTGTSNMTISITVTGTAGNTYYVNVAYHKRNP